MKVLVTFMTLHLPTHFVTDVAYGSLITLKQRRTGGAYLHSHSHLYPEEHPPRQQQVRSILFYLFQLVCKHFAYLGWNKYNIYEVLQQAFPIYSVVTVGIFF